MFRFASTLEEIHWWYIGLLCLLVMQPAIAGPVFYEVPLPSGVISFTKGDVDLEDGPYFIVQFDRSLTHNEMVKLAALGVRPLSFIYRGAWICRIEATLTDKTIKKYSIVGVIPWKPDYKMSRDEREGKVEEWALTDAGEIKLLVTFFEDVNTSEMENVLSQNSSSYRIFRSPNVWAVQTNPSVIEHIITIQIIESIQVGPRPDEPTNDYSRAIMNVDDIQGFVPGTPPSYELAGKGVNVAVVDVGNVDVDHLDFFDHSVNPPLSRVTNYTRATSAVHSHATHVAGTIGGNGWTSRQFSGAPFQWRGIAPEVELIVTDFDSPNFGYLVPERFPPGFFIHASNHSTKGGVASDLVDKDIHGDSQGDNLKYRQRPHIWGADNRGASVGYYAVTETAKNVISVGAVNANDHSLWAHSSLGPTPDGRIKPDVVGPGCKNFLDPDTGLSLGVRVDIDSIIIWGRPLPILFDPKVIRAWRFNNDGEFEGWSFDIPIKEVVDGHLRLQVPIKGGEGYVDDVNVFANTSQEVWIRYRVDTGGVPVSGPFKVFWTGTRSDGSREGPLITDGAFHTVKFNVGRDDAWSSAGRIDRLGIAPINVATNGIVSTQVGGGYWEACGTSMAAPAVTGTVALMLEAYAREFNKDIDTEAPLPSTVKALLIHTTTDLIHEKADVRDPNNPDTGEPTLYHKGPDFATGYGLVNAKAAIEHIRAAAKVADENRSLMLESELDVGQQDAYVLHVESPLPGLKVTIAWDDSAASISRPAGNLGENLVNDLDLVLVGPSGRHYHPWRVDPLPPETPIPAFDVKRAYKGPDARNNVEQVYIDNPDSGEWKIVVYGDDIQDVADGLQTYSIVASEPFDKLTDSSPAELRIRGDFNGDHLVDQQDLDIILNHIFYVSNASLRDRSFDITQDGRVDLVDAFAIDPTIIPNFNINGALSWPHPGEGHFFEHTFGCPDSSKGTFNIVTKLTNSHGRAPFSDLILKVNKLTKGNLLKDADGGPGGVGATKHIRPDIREYEDGILGRGESATVVLSICLNKIEPFLFYVDVFGIARERE